MTDINRPSTRTILRLVRELRNMGATHVKVGDFHVLFPGAAPQPGGIKPLPVPEIPTKEPMHYGRTRAGQLTADA